MREKKTLVFIRAVLAKYCKLDGLNNRNLFSHNSENWNSEIKVSTFPSEDSKESASCFSQASGGSLAIFLVACFVLCITLMSAFISNVLSLCVCLEFKFLPFVKIRSILVKVTS